MLVSSDGCLQAAIDRGDDREPFLWPKRDRGGPFKKVEEI
jgi:hypothetical protein